jgi:hypothetical protein
MKINDFFLNDKKNQLEWPSKSQKNVKNYLKLSKKSQKIYLQF